MRMVSSIFLLLRLSRKARARYESISVLFLMLPRGINHLARKAITNQATSAHLGSRISRTGKPIARCPDHPILAALCLRPSARPHPPIDVLLITKAKPQFDRAVDRAVEALFRVFRPSNHVVSALPPPGRNILTTIFHIFLPNTERITPKHSANISECTANFGHGFELLPDRISEI
jgi:hypothetical protein